MTGQADGPVLKVQSTTFFQTAKIHAIDRNHLWVACGHSGHQTSPHAAGLECLLMACRGSFDVAEHVDTAHHLILILLAIGCSLLGVQSPGCQVAFLLHASVASLLLYTIAIANETSCAGTCICAGRIHSPTRDRCKSSWGVPLGTAEDFELSHARAICYLRSSRAAFCNFFTSSMYAGSVTVDLWAVKDSSLNVLRLQI